MRAKMAAMKRGLAIRWIAIILSVAGLIAMLAVTAFAQNTYVITDGDQVTVHTSFTADPAKALNQAGVALDAEDTYTTEAVDGVSEITVQRAMSVAIDNCGEKIHTTSYGETLEALFDRLGIQMSEDYQVSLPLSTQTYDGMEVTIRYIVESTETYTVEIPFETSYYEDPSMPAGEEKVLVEGKAGQMLCKAQVIYRDGGEQYRNVQQQTVVEQPVNRIIAVGTDAAEEQQLPIIGDGVIILPTGEVLTYTHKDKYVATAYTKTDEGCDDYTATGSLVHVGVVAVDPSVVPYGTRMFIVSNDGEYIYGVATAEDCGTGVDGKRLDLYMDTTAECFTFGIRDCTVYFLGGANWK